MAAANLDALGAAERRTWRAFFEDGLDDAFLGVMLLLVALGAAAPSGWRPVVWFGIVVGVVGLARAHKAAKRTVIRPGTGFVRPPKPRAVFTKNRLLLLVVGGYAVAGLIALIQVGNPSLPPLFPLIPFAMWAIIFLARAWKTGYARYYALTVVPGIAAALAWPVEAKSWRDIAVLFGAVGLGLAASGAWALRQYLRRYPSTVDDG